MITATPPNNQQLPPERPIALDGRDDHWWAVANSIANEMLEAKTLAQMDRVSRASSPLFDGLKHNRPDLAQIVAIIFEEKRQQLEQCND